MSRQRGESVYLAGRSGELGSIDELRAEAWGGRGTGVLIQGATGVGRTALLRAACERARRAGALVFEAEADRLETDCPFGVVRQLFEGVDGSWRAPGLDEPHELYDRAMDLAAGRPMVVAVDDLHWSDEASARWLAYLLRRIHGRRVLVIATTSLPTDVIDAGLVSRFDHEIVLEGLRTEAVVDLAGETLGTPVEKKFGASCHQATDGNPLLLHAVLRTVRESGRPVSRAVLSEVLASPPPDVLTWLRRTLATYGPGAGELVEVIAAFGEPVELDLAVATAELATERAAHLVDALVAVRLLRWCQDRVSLRPPLVQAAVLAGLEPGAGKVLRARAARLLHARGAPPTDIAAQLVRSGPLGEPWAADVLCAVAAKATAEDDSDRALDHLRSALREPMSSQRRSEVMVRIASVQPPADIASAVDYLRRALDIAPDIAVRAAAARRLAGLLCLSQRHQEGMRVLRNVAEPARDLSPDVAVTLEVEEALLGMFHLPSPDLALIRFADRVDRTEELENDALGILWSVRAMMSGRQRQQATELLSRALDHGLSQVNEASLHHPMSVLTLAVAGELELALHHADKAVCHARRTHSALGGARALAVRSEVNYRLGRLDECRNDARACRETLVQFGTRRADGMAMVAAARLADALVDTGDLDAAEQVIAVALGERPVPASLFGTWLLASRGRLRQARGEIREGVDDLLETGRRLRSWQVTNPAIIPWRSLAGLGYAAMGMNSAACELVEEELTLARQWGSAQAIGMALRAAGRAAKGSAGVTLFREAAAVLTRSDASLEHARALADLGTALRKTNQLADARHHLRQAATSAQRCGAEALVRFARAELIAAGARPRSQAHCGLDSLTPTEHRVARLAAQGLSNREISERLFVVRRTVELHLSSVYRKLGVNGRADLPARMPSDRK
ncbi:AAA family ATPase [Streptomyces sp. 6N106]|uniref:AAA family ATPase n=1 Tax=Streptomyces sp. 6N106 TaxID=3457418 RepID=UPI003FD2AFE6